jgi:hypothetical protein
MVAALMSRHGPVSPQEAARSSHGTRPFLVGLAGRRRLLDLFGAANSAALVLGVATDLNGALTCRR